MKKKRWLRGGGGVLDTRTILVLSLVAISVLNACDIIAGARPPIRAIGYVFPFVACAIFLYSIKQKVFDAVLPFLFFTLSVLMFFFATMPPPFPGAIAFFIFSIHVSCKRKRIIFCFSMEIFVIFKTTFLDTSHNTLLTHTLLYVLATLLYFSLTRQKSPEVVIPSISYEDRQIIQHLAAGKTKKEIASELFITADAVSKRISRIKKTCGVATTEQLVYTLAIKGLIRQK